MYQARCRGLYEPQDPLNALWKLCAIERIPFSRVAESYRWSIDDMIRAGLTRNMTIRTLWFDVNAFRKLGGFQVIQSLRIDRRQYSEWNLSINEMDSMDIRWTQVEQRFGTEFRCCEQKRLGVFQAAPSECFRQQQQQQQEVAYDTCVSMAPLPFDAGSTNLLIL